MHSLVILIAKDFIVLPVLIAAYVWLRLESHAKRRFLILVVGGAIGSVLLAKIGSKLFYDPRPFVAGHFQPYFSHSADNGFPSDHTLLASFLAFVTLRFSRFWGGIALAIAILIGLTRVVAGVHHLVDILGSIICAGLAVLIVNQLAGRFLPAPRSRNPNLTRPPADS